MNFPVVIHKDSKSDFGVTVPDLEGCFSAGESIEIALENTKEAILCHIEGLIQDGESIPEPSSIDSLKSQFDDGLWALVSVDLSQLFGKSKRINITFPDRLLSNVDKFAKKHGESRSGILVTAAMEYIATHQE